MTQAKYISTAKVAEALGVGVSTVKRWADSGVLPAHRTAGGHRKLLLADVLQMVRSEELPCANLALLNLPSEDQYPDLPAMQERLLTALQQGQDEIAHHLIVSLGRSEMSFATLGDEILSPVMRNIGHGWEENQLDVYEEHRSTQTCISAVLELRSGISRTTDIKKPLAVGGGSEGDPYLLCNLLAELILLDQGWRVVNLGANTPLTSLEKAIGDLSPQLVWLSVSYIANRKRFFDQLPQLIATAAKHNCGLMLGGQALPKNLKQKFPQVQVGMRLHDLQNFSHTFAADA